MPRILIADDAEIMRLRLRLLLAEQGHEVLEAEDGAQAVSMYREHRPDLVLMDYIMPNQNGLEALAEIRRLDPQARVVILTWLSQHTLIQQCMQAGARSFLLKPPTAPELEQTISTALAPAGPSPKAASRGGTDELSLNR
ncbi:MAG TPA: response regulator [Herpetosiphonaceae bacterium]